MVFTLPPPTHGSNIINQCVSKLELSHFAHSEIFPLRYTDSISDIGILNYRKIRKLIKYLFELNKKLKTFLPEYVYFVPAISGLSFLRDCTFIFLFKRYDIKIIIHLHGKGIQKKAKSTIGRMIYKWFFKNTTIIHLSKNLLYDLENIVNVDNIHILPNGVEPFSKIYDNDKRNITRNLTLLFLSNFIKSKGIIDFLEACSLLKEQGYCFNIILIGNFTKTISKEILSKTISNLNLKENILHIGPAYGKEKNKLLSASDIFVFPSFYDKECFPLVILEAMSTGLPVISTNEGAISEIIDHNITGFIVDKRNVRSIASHISGLMEDSELRLSMAIKSLEKYNGNYTLKLFEKNFKSLIFSIMNN